MKEKTELEGEIAALDNREASVWRAWFAKMGSGWDEVEDIASESDGDKS